MIFNITNGPGRKVPILDPAYPQDVSVTKVGTSATFQVVIAKDGIPDEYTFQWYYDDVAVDGATGINYTRAAAIGTHKVHCMVTNKAGSVKSRTATVSATILYLYNSGDLCTAATGGWKGTGVALNDIYTTKGVPKVTKNSTNMVVEPNASKACSSGIYHTVNKINLSGYSKLYFDGILYSNGANKVHASVGVWSAIGEKAGSNRVALYQGLGDAVRTIDVSNLNGSYYIGVFVFKDDNIATVGGGKVTIRKMYVK